MTDSDTTGVVGQTKPDNSLPEMSFWQKADFIGLPLMWTLLSLTWFLLGCLTVILFVLSFILLLMHRIRGTDLPGLILGLLVGLVFLALSTPILRSCGSKLLKATQRMRATGSYFPRGKELIKLKAASQKRPLWKRIVVVAFFVWLAVPPTARIILTDHRHSPLTWAIAVLLWTAAILLAIAWFPSRAEPRWLSPTVAVTFGIISLLSARIALNPQEPRGFWGYSALMLTLSIVSAVDAFRSSRRRIQLPYQSAS